MTRMQLNLGQLMSMVTSLNQGRTDYATSDLSRYVNQAIAELCARVPMRSLEDIGNVSCTSGSRTISYAGQAVNYFTSIYNDAIAPGTAGRELTQTTAEWIDSQTTHTGIPTHYAPYGWNTLYVWPSANSAWLLTTRYQQRVQEVTSSTGTANIDFKWYPAVAYRAAAIAAAERNDLEQEAVNQARYLGLVNSTPLDVEFRQKQTGGFSVSIPCRK